MAMESVDAISPPQINGDTTHHIHSRSDLQSQNYSNVFVLPPAFWPGGSRALCTISLYSVCLGIGLGLCIELTLYLAYSDHYLWRITFFLATLCVFHYLEFDMTARYNSTDAKVGSFLLFTNGAAYNIAHCAAMTECVLRFLWKTYGLRVLSVPENALPDVLPTIPAFVPVMMGFAMIVVGQTTRSLAMKTAGKSFNHIVQSTKRSDHTLVTRGVYTWCRHPAYFGFFWWAVGTQFVLGNWLCLLAYIVLLWSFFNKRITHEEKHLVQFFGDDYLKYRKATLVWIPFIR